MLEKSISKRLKIPEKINLFTVPIRNCLMSDALGLIFSHVAEKTPAMFAFVNADCMNKAWENSLYRDTLHKMTSVFADGIGVKLAAKMDGKLIVDNVNGTDMFPLLCAEAAKRGVSIYLLGAKSGVAGLCAKKMQEKIPGLVFAGTHDGYFDESEVGRVIERINESSAGILVVAFGAPLQELWMDKFRDQITVPVCIGVGGCFDFYSEKISRAPLWVRNLSLEWVWRLLQEPGRMWNRYIIGNPLFLCRAWQWSRVKDDALPYHTNSLFRQIDSFLKINSWKMSVLGSKIMKRAMDVAMSLSLISILSPLFLVVGIAIKLESKGPILFSQTRIGLNGKPFRFWKFRSMRTDAEQTKKDLAASGMVDETISNGVRFKIKKDPRITKIGAFIRKYSIDELPQLWNVLIGDMSLVGPRPALPQEVALYDSDDEQRLSLVPGITGIWQISGRSDIPFKDQVKLDIQYHQRQSIICDLKVLLLTIPAVISGKGAY